MNSSQVPSKKIPKSKKNKKKSKRIPHAAVFGVVSSASPSQQTSADAEQGTDIMPKCYSSKFLCLCFTEDVKGESMYDSDTYHFMSVELSKLFDDTSRRQHDQSVLQEVASFEDGFWPCGMAFVHTKNGSLYAVSHGAGLTPADRYIAPKGSLKMLRYDICYKDGSSSINLNLAGPIKPMRSRLRYSHPILVEIKGRIYVLSTWPPTGCISDFEEGIVFEVYDPVDDEWTALDSPPFLRPYVSLFGYSTHLKYVVVGNKFYVSTSVFSCAFDTETKKWAGCDLFDDLLTQRYWSRVSVQNYDVSEFRRRCDEDQLWGPPLPFHKDALLIYDKYLLTTLEAWKVVAYKIEDGKLSEKPETLLEGNPELAGCGSVGSFMDLGDGYVCFLGLVKSGKTGYAYLDLEKSIEDLSKPAQVKFFKGQVSDGEGLSFTNLDVSTVTLEEGSRWWGRIDFFFTCDMIGSTNKANEMR